MDRDAIIAGVADYLGEGYSVETIAKAVDSTFDRAAASDTMGVIATVAEAVLVCSKQPLRQIRDSYSEQPNALRKLKWKEDRTVRPIKRPKTDVSHLELNENNITRYLPCELFLDWVEAKDADDLLRFLMRDSSREDSSWSVNRYHINEKEVRSSHKSAMYTNIPEDKFSHTFQAYTTKAAPYSKSAVLESVSSRIDSFVTERLRKTQVRLHTKVSESPLRQNGNWTGNMCVANEYANGTEVTGFHADSLAYLGPRPVIASVSVGATRTFRVRRIKEAADLQLPVWELSDQECDQTQLAAVDWPIHGEYDKVRPNGEITTDTSSTVYSIKLPHGSLLIMYPPMQELYKHEIALDKNGYFPRHKISGYARYNLTFRMRRDEFSDPPICRCGVRTDLKPAFKSMVTATHHTFDCDEPNQVDGTKTANERYYFSCVKGRGDAAGCGFFSWLESPNMGPRHIGIERK
ncbi:hypothetical protein HDU83_008698 [Entophlyctis luteolus]|nr:hypothetical protein HDU83_008698 [Entophlyctis luteolus]